MSRVKPTTDIDVIGNVDPRPEQVDLDKYFDSKQQEKYFLKIPNWDSTGLSLETIFIRLQHEHSALRRQLQELQKSRELQAVNDIARVRRMYETESDLRKQLISVTNFIRDCQEKKKMARQKLKEQQELQDEMRIKREDLKVDVKKLRLFQAALMKLVNSYEPYENVMHQVVEERSDVFSSVEDCIARCDALMMVQVEIRKLGNQKLAEIEELRRHLIEIAKEAALRMLGLKTELTEMQRSYEKVRAECLRWERILAQAKDTVASHDCNKEMTISGLHHLYLLLCKRRRLEPALATNNVEAKVDFIKDEVEILTAVVEELSQSQTERRRPNQQRPNISTKKIIKC